MTDLSHSSDQIQYVTNFQDLVATPFTGKINAICWNRELTGDFSEIAEKVELTENLATLDQKDLIELQLSEQGQLAREILLNDFRLLKAYGASPTLNLIKHYDRDDSYSFF